MVVKEETHTRQQWRSSDPIYRDVPPEVKIMSRLNKSRCHAIPRLYHYRRYKHVYRHRLYMEFCPYRDLSVLLSRYRRFRQFLPEPFLWDTFFHLVEAARAMRDGLVGEEWGDEVVHRDVKPGNGEIFSNSFFLLLIVGLGLGLLGILCSLTYFLVFLVFLGVENPEKGFPFYPVAKLGDFGLAIMTNKHDEHNPHGWVGAGTLGYLAPVSTVSFDRTTPRIDDQHN